MPNNIVAKILADSITDGAHRLTTFELTYPRFIHSELLTHRMLSRNSASSRAIPAEKLRARTLVDPAVPLHWGKNQKGMQANEELTPVQQAQAKRWWTDARNMAAGFHAAGEELGLHKQIVNRLIEPWMMITVICSATEWANFFALRRHKDAEPNFQALANAMWGQYVASTPKFVPVGDWHLPMVYETEEDLLDAIVIRGTEAPAAAHASAGRCARVSYLTHEGVRDVNADIALCEKLASNDPMHASPLEHPAMAIGPAKWDGPRVNHFGNFFGWKQLRYFYPTQAGPAVTKRCAECGLWEGAEPRHTNGCSSAFND